MSWIDDGLKATKENEDRKRLATQRQLHIAEVRKAKARGLLDKITAAATEAVNDYRAKTEGQSERRVDYTAKPSGGFELSKPFYPAASVECTLDAAAAVLNIVRSFSANAEAQTQITRSALQLKVDDSDDLWVVLESGQMATPEKTAENLLRPVLFA
jgi:hypothetical protein